MSCYSCHFYVATLQMAATSQRKVALFIFCIIVLLSFSPLVHGSVTVLQNNFTASFVLIEYAGTPTDLPNQLYELTLDNGNDLNGKFVLLQSRVPIEASLRDIQRRGAVGALVQSRQDIPPGRNTYYVTGESTLDITLIAGDIWFEDYNTIHRFLNESGNATISISNFDENRWKTVVGSSGFIAWQVLLAGIHASVLIFTIVMFAVMVKQQGCRLNVVQFICISEAMGLLIRTAYLCVDPLFVHRITHYTASQMLLTFSLPFGMATNFLIIFYWQEVLDKRRTKLTVSPFLDRLKPLFIVVVIVLFLLDIAGGITRGLDLPAFSTVVTANAAIYNVAVLTMAIWIFLTYRKTTSEFLKTKKTLSTKDKKLQRISRLILFSGIANVLVVVSSLFILIRSIYWNPVGFYTIWFLTYFFFTVRGFIQILVITPRRGANASTESFRSSVNNMESGVRSFAQSQNRDSLRDSLRDSKPAEELKAAEPKNVEPTEISTELPVKKSTDNLNESESSSSSSSSSSDTDSHHVE